MRYNTKALKCSDRNDSEYSLTESDNHVEKTEIKKGTANSEVEPTIRELLQQIASNTSIQNQPREKRLLTVAEFAKYLGIGQTTAREVLKQRNLKFRVRINNTIMINKKLLDEYLDENSF